MKRLSIGSSQRQRGLTLVELLVAVAINLVVVLVAAYLYLNGRSTQQAVEERSALFENGQLALELIGQEIGNAGFYPAHMKEPGVAIAVNRGRYVNPQPAVPAYGAGVFGCDTGRFDGTVCQSSVGAKDFKGDGLVLNYFTDDAMTTTAGSRADCQGNRVDNATTINTDVRLGAAKNLVNRAPEHPLFVSNAYTLTDVAYPTPSGRSISTFGLACRGIGSAAPAYQMLVPGIEQLRIRYGLRDASGMRATTYVNAAGVGAAGTITVNDESMTGWERVVSVQVCVVARSLSETRFRGAGAETRLDCDDAVLPNDGVQRRRFMQVFAVKNRVS